MTSKINTVLVLLAAFTLAFTGCKDAWEEETSITDQALRANLLQRVEENPDLSKFKEYLTQTGYDQVLASSKKYTVWAPTNQALANLDAAILNDPEQLKKFVANHIVNQAYTRGQATELRLKTLNGKYVKFHGTRLEDAQLVQGDTWANNGILHVINKAVMPKMNVWEYVQTTAYQQKDAILALDYTVLDPNKAEQTGVDPSTGKPIYKPGSGVVAKNHLFDKTGHLGNEDQEYTFILLTNDALAAEKEKLKPYTNGGNPDSTDKLASLYVMKDLAFKGLYLPEDLPAFLYSEDGVKVPLDKSAIVDYQLTSNGIVYTMRAADVPLADKLVPRKVEGEEPVGFSRTDKAANITYRLRRNPETGQLFNDIYIFNHKVPLFHVKYQLANVYSGTYKVYWVAPNDVQTVKFKQRFAVNDPASEHFPETEVALDNFKEVYVGEFTVDQLGNLDLYIVGADNGVDQTNSISLDYFRLVPQLP
ncbi:fasciclin domain-containing protein [Rufibacter psychrotolerans]|uniref:fasciclin domain-containing protein n=1 Tax=Rufibacter psychrotolerans TaxID=2812556 RepID=UPI0019672D30|nr:fasciclin domain-containing protein [Rufibacter sp. SYSU D00308]